MPSRSEISAVARGLAKVPPGMSARSACKVLARRVVRHLVEVNDNDDPVALALSRTIAAIEDDPAWALASDPEINLVDALRRERARRFEARGCRQLPPAAWEAETRAIAAELEGRLTERFRKVARKWGNGGDFPNPPRDGQASTNGI